MKMRDYELLKDIQIPDEQEKMMDIICDDWHECLNSDCKNCIDRPEKFMTLFSCFCLKCTRRLIEAGYKKQDTQEVKHGKWINDFYNDYHCSECGAEAPNDGYDCGANYCYNCGAKMDEVKDDGATQI